MKSNDEIVKEMIEVLFAARPDTPPSDRPLLAEKIKEIIEQKTPLPCGVNISQDV